MARPLRLALPGVSLHVIQRGNNRAPCFFQDGDYRLYLECLRTGSEKFDCSVHAYVLMTNHVHLLVTPSEAPAVSSLIQWIGRRYVRIINKRDGRSGTLWEGRFRSSLVDRESYFLACQRYIELNPVRAGMVRQARDYPWSSHRHHVEGGFDSLLVAHASYLALGDTPAERRTAYEALCACDLAEDMLESIRTSAAKGRPFGSKEFKARVEAITGPYVRTRKRGAQSQKATRDAQATLL